LIRRPSLIFQRLHFICEPGIEETNTVIQSAIEQAKMKFNIPTSAAAPDQPQKE
jgi:hypothetical protein